MLNRIIRRLGEYFVDPVYPDSEIMRIGRNFLCLFTFISIMTVVCLVLEVSK